MSNPSHSFVKYDTLSITSQEQLTTEVQEKTRTTETDGDVGCCINEPIEHRLLAYLAVASSSHDRSSLRRFYCSSGSEKRVIHRPVPARFMAVPPEI